MADSTTPKYGLVKPEPTSLMSNFPTYLNGNWDKLTAIPAPDVITGALPQAGNYVVGDRVFRTNDNSIYLLICQDPKWGWVWRPIHAAISPWVTLPTAMNQAAGLNWSFSVDATNPVAYALDNRGNMHLRGAIGLTTGLISPNSSINVFYEIPVGIRPSNSAMYTLGHNAFGAATGHAEMARLFINANGANSFRVTGTFATTCQMSKLYLDGNIQYSIGDRLFGAA